MNASHCSPADIRRSTSLLHLPHHHPVRCPLLPSPSFIPDCDMRVTHSSSSPSFPLLSLPPPAPLVLHLNLFLALIPRLSHPLRHSASATSPRFLPPSPSPDLPRSTPPRPFPPLLFPLLRFFLFILRLPPFLPSSPVHPHTRSSLVSAVMCVSRARAAAFYPHPHPHPPNQPVIPPTARRCQPMRRRIGPLPHFIAHEV